MTYRELLERLEKLPDSELDRQVVVTDFNTDTEGVAYDFCSYDGTYDPNDTEWFISVDTEHFDAI